MLRDSYSKLDGALKIGLIDVVQNHTLYQLITAAIDSVKEQLISCTPGPGMELEYAVIQQRLISLEDLKDFFETVRTELTPQPDTE